MNEQLMRWIRRSEKRLEALERIEVPVVSGGAGVAGSGTNNYLAQWTAATTIGDSDIIDDVTGDDLTITAALTAGRTLTLPDADVTITGGGTFAMGGFTLTVPATGTAVLGGGSGAANRVTYWSDANTLASDAGLQVDTANDLYIVADGGGIGASSADVRTLYDTTNGYIEEWLGDDSGDDEWRVLDSAGALVASVDSDGLVDIYGQNLVAANNNVNVRLGGDSAGSGNYTAGIGFAMSLASSGARSAIAGRQGTADADQIGLSFFVHPDVAGANPIVEVLRLTYDGNMVFGDVRDAGGDVTIIRDDGNTTFDVVGDANNDEANTIVVHRFYINGAPGGAGTSKGTLSYDESVDLFGMSYGGVVNYHLNIASTGNVLIGHTTDNGYRLDIDAGAMRYAEMAAPSAPAANSVVVYADDDGAGKTRLMALFSSGAAQQIAIQP